MDVRCDNCGTEYEFDDDKLTPQGVNVKCTSCGHVFRVSKPVPLAKEPQPQPQAQGDWMIRQANGGVFRFKELTTLQKWIVERKVSRNDEISRNGGTWKRLGQIPELGAFFQAVDKTRKSSDEFEDTIDDITIGHRQGHRLATALVLVAVAAAVFLVSFVFRERIAQLFGANTPQPTTSIASLDIEAGVRAYKKDTLASFASAETLLGKATQAVPPSAQAFAAAAINEIAWADALREQTQGLDAVMKAAETGQVQLPVAQVAEKAETLAKLRGEVAAHGERASADIARAIEIDPASDDVTRANARLAASKNDRQALLPIVERIKDTPLGANEDIGYALALTDMNSAETLDNAQAALQKIIDKDADFIAARYKLAWIAVQKKDPRAPLLVDEVLRRSPDHERALALKKKLAPAAPASMPASAPAEAAKAPVKESFDQLLNHANGLREHDRARQAMEVYDRALAMEPDNSEALTGMGFCMLDLDQTEAALTEFNKAIQSNARFSDAYMGLAEAYRAKNQKRDAVKNYQKYLDLTPDGPEAEAAKRELSELGQGN